MSQNGYYALFLSDNVWKNFLIKNLLNIVTNFKVFRFLNPYVWYFRLGEIMSDTNKKFDDYFNGTVG